MQPMKSLGPFTPDGALDNPFELGDGWIYFTSVGDIVRTRKKKWEVVAHLKERINCVTVERDGRFSCAGAKGILHHWDGSSWHRTKLGFANVLGLVWTGGSRYVCGGADGEVAFVDGRTVTRNDLNFGIMNCASEQNRTWFVGEGVHRHDGGQFFTQEHEVMGLSVCIGDTVYVGTHAEGGSSSHVLRRVAGTWERIDIQPLRDEDVFDLAWWQDALYIANQDQLGRFVPGVGVELLRTAPTERVRVIQDRIVTCGRGAAAIYDGATWLSLV